MKKEKNKNQVILKDSRNVFEMSRRDFLRKFGGGVVIAFSLSEMALLTGCAPEETETDEPGVNAFLRIGEDGRVTLFTGKIEMGQGPITSLPMEIADELDVSLDSVDIIMGDTELCPWDNATAGSTTTRIHGEILRKVCAEARAILLKMAASELSVSRDELTVSDGLVWVEGDKTKQISYGELTQGKEILETVSEQPPVKKASEFKVMGKPRKRDDALVKVTGEAKYSGDIQLPGMMYARIIRAPSYGAKLLSIDTSEAEAMEGVEIVRDGDLVAVLHESQDIANLAITRVRAEFEEDNPPVDDTSLYDYFIEQGTKSGEEDSRGNRQQGDLEEGRNNSVQHFDSEFKDPYLAHAPIEPHAATAVFEGDNLKIWASSQNPFPTGRNIAETLGIPEDNVRLMQIFTGGGFGGKLQNPQALEVARLAKLSGKPVQLVYSREEEFFMDGTRPAAVMKLSSGLDDQGNISYWDYTLYFGGTRGADPFYDIPNLRTRQFTESEGSRGHIFNTGAWRAPSNNTNTFARESQIEIMAAEAGVDPLEFRLRHLEGNPKMAGVLRTGADRFGWTPAKGPSGRGYGIACAIDAGTMVATFAEVSVDETSGHVQVKRAVCCQNMGMVVNPQGAIIQIEGALIMGLGYALSEEIKFEGRKMLTRNYDTYGITRFSWTPKIDAVLIDAQDEDPQGGGEPAVVPVGGAIANAIFDACGARLYQQPMTPERVLEAIQESKTV